MERLGAGSSTAAGIRRAVYEQSNISRAGNTIINAHNFNYNVIMSELNVGLKM